jgi:3,4-dihydroxy-2-butanone 4-phosphate synthase
MKAADITPVALGCEMLANNGNALSSEEARIWAREQGYLFLEGRQIMEACQ